jgi:hypothetical protein
MAGGQDRAGCLTTQLGGAAFRQAFPCSANGSLTEKGERDCGDHREARDG